MPELESLTLRIELDLSGLRRGLREAKQLVSQSSRSMIQSLAGVEESLRRIGDTSATLIPPAVNPERQISIDDRIAGAGIGASIAAGAIAITSAIASLAASTVALALAAGAILGAFIPKTEALLSNALSGLSTEERIANLENRISGLQSMQGIRTGIEFGDASREKELAEKIRRLQLERTELLRQLDSERALQDKLNIGDVGLIGGSESVETLIGFAEMQSNALNTVAQKSEEARVSIRSLDGAARDLGFTFASSFEDAVVEGRNLSDVLQGLEQDILRILTRKLVTEPLAGALTGLIGSGVGAFAGQFHGGGRVGSTPVPGRVVPASFFDGAPRFAGGGMIGRVPRLAPGEVPAILHRGEVVRTPAQEAALGRNGGGSGGTPIVVNIQTPNPRAFNESRGQIQAMLADAVNAGRRNR